MSNILYAIWAKVLYVFNICLLYMCQHIKYIILLIFYIYSNCCFGFLGVFFSFQPVLHDWCNKGRGMCYPVCGMIHIKEPLLLIGKSSLCGSRFPLSLSEWSFTICLTPYNRKLNVLSVLLNKTFPSHLLTLTSETSTATNQILKLLIITSTIFIPQSIIRSHDITFHIYPSM